MKVKQKMTTKLLPHYCYVMAFSGRNKHKVRVLVPLYPWGVCSKGWQACCTDVRKGRLSVAAGSVSLSVNTYFTQYVF